MSLVNDCLEDIKERRAPGDPISDRSTLSQEHVVGIVGAPRQRFYEKPAFIPSLVAAACVAVVAIEVSLRMIPAVTAGNANFVETPSVSARPPSAIDTVPFAFQTTRGPVPEASIVETPDPEIAQLTRVEVEPHAGFTRLRLHLSQEREYEIEGSASEGEIEVLISGTRLSRAFSPQSFVGTGLFLRETHNTSEGLHLVIGVDAASQVQTQFVSDGSGTQLVLDVLETREERATRLDNASESGQTVSWGRIDQSEPEAPGRAVEAFEAFDRARELVAQNRPAEAVAETVRALSLDPDLHPAREHLVAQLIQSGQLNAANDHLARGIERAPEHSVYNLLRAQLLVAMKQPRRAIAVLESFPTPASRRSDALNLLAALYQQEGDHERAEALFRNAVRLAPHEGRLWMGLGISLEGQNRKSEALAVYQQAESLAEFGNGPRSWLRSRIRELTTVE